MEHDFYIYDVYMVLNKGYDMKKVTDEELKEIQELRNSLLIIISALGELHLNKVLIKRQLTEIESSITEQEERFAEFQQQEKVIFDQLQQKYGTGNISMDTGEITE